MFDLICDFMSKVLETTRWVKISVNDKILTGKN